MTDAYDCWNLTDRQTQIVTALTALVQRGQLRPEQLQDVEALYQRGLVFEAERVAAFAIWLATSPPQAQLQALPERLGVLIQAWHTLGAVLATIDQWELWRPYADTLEAFQRDCVQVSPRFYTALLHLASADAPPLPVLLTDRGRALQRVMTLLTTQDPLLRMPASTMHAAEYRALTLDDLTTSAQQIVEALLWLGRTLRSIRLWELWVDQAPSYTAFLDTILGLGSRVGAGLVGFAAAWETTRHTSYALGTVETAVQIVMGHTPPAIRRQKGARR